MPFVNFIDLRTTTRCGFSTVLVKQLSPVWVWLELSKHFDP